MGRRKKIASVDIAAQFAEKQAEEASVLTEIEEIKRSIADAKAALKEKKNALKSVQRQLSRLEVLREKEEENKAEERKKVILQAKIKEMVANGTSYEDILSKLN